jgi:hypothetical protein
MPAQSLPSIFRAHPKIFILLCVVISVIPLLLPTLPPLTDLLGHIGRYRVQLDLASDPLLQRFYGFEWALIGNLGVDLLVQVIGPLIGLEPAVKLIVIAIVALTTGSFLLLSYQVHGRIGAASFFALPLAYSFPFQFGFVNYCLSMALAFLAFALWLKLSASGQIRLRLVLFMPISFIIWLAHISGWGAFGLFAFAAECIRLRDVGDRWSTVIIKGGLHCVPLALPLIIMVISRSSGADGGTGDWFQWAIKYQWVMMILRDQWQGFDIASVTILLLIIPVAAVSSGLRFNHTLGLATLFLGAAFLIMPRILIGSAYADMRLAPYVLALGLLAIETKLEASTAFRGGFMVAGLLFFVARTAATTESFRRYDAVITAELGAISHIPRGARVAAFLSLGCDTSWMLERRSHAPSIALARRNAFVNDQFLLGGAQLLQIRYKAAAPFDRDPSQFMTGEACLRDDWRSFRQAMQVLPRGAFDYIWVITKPEDRGVDYSGLTPAWRNGASTLYRIERR